MGRIKHSAGLLMYRFASDRTQFFLVHPGGPLFVHKDAGYWGVPKGEADVEGEDLLAVARREFEEETGQSVAACGGGDSFLGLGTVRQRSGKTIHAWAFEGDWPAGAELESNLFSLEWPPRSGRFQQFPEVDAGRFFALDEAREKINAAQLELLERLLHQLGRQS